MRYALADEVTIVNNVEDVNITARRILTSAKTKELIKEIVLNGKIGWEVVKKIGQTSSSFVKPILEMIQEGGREINITLEMLERRKEIENTEKANELRLRLYSRLEKDLKVIAKSLGKLSQKTLK